MRGGCCDDPDPDPAVAVDGWVSMGWVFVVWVVVVAGRAEQGLGLVTMA